MAKYDKISPETQQEAMKIARANQKPGQTKEQTQLIAQGIQKGIDEYKKQMKARAREANRQKKQQAKARQQQSENQLDEQDESLELVEVTRQHPLPWALLVLSWLGFAAGWLWLR
ncbi:DUF2956 domain-containing protein [Aeromonas sp. FDAARGOS 1407]|uniref:DUF2956 domain-containing protein n=1 Tax=Aeromonas TaxID=642 RepID=UPI001C22C07E|nr:DUF2956 domain-containing protein [Aeromonas sp. FDAARGOS 1407]QXC34107.1 DUF2956 domain-containing protein [Aeromonas sp. FDAARGOS 1407]